MEVNYKMDFIPDVEFHGIFVRVNEIVVLKGINGPNEILKRINLAIKGDRRYRRYRSMPRGSVSFLQHIAVSFSKRAWDQAVTNPNGIESLTFKYGREEARRKLLRRGLERTKYLQWIEKRKGGEDNDLVDLD